ncbi:hypothetical protein BJF78_23760 [Pseudonocardia sp. CNS-139]|nr:hypothetical protein BJF78_23760 [Pseudonocardia sp. CNS-139]
MAGPGGVLDLPGAAEAAHDLVRLSGAAPVAAFATLVSDRDPRRNADPGEAAEFAARHGLRAVTVDDLIAHRRGTEQGVRRVAAAGMPLPQGTFTALGYQDLLGSCEHVALVLGDVLDPRAVLRVHRECLSGDVFGSRSCECRHRLDRALDAVAAAGHGAVLYLRAGAGTVRERSAGRQPAAEEPGGPRVFYRSVEQPVDRRSTGWWRRSSAISASIPAVPAACSRSTAPSTPRCAGWPSSARARGRIARRGIRDGSAGHEPESRTGARNGPYDFPICDNQAVDTLVTKWLSYRAFGSLRRIRSEAPPVRDRWLGAFARRDGRQQRTPPPTGPTPGCHRPFADCRNGDRKNGCRQRRS